MSECICADVALDAICQPAESLTDASPSLELMVTMGYPKDEITESLHGQKYDDVMATYLLLGRKAPEVSLSISSLCIILCDPLPHPLPLHVSV